MAEVEPARFRQLLGRFATGVTVVTATGPDGNPVGMTANTLVSVSLHPPLISVCIDQTADMHQTLQQTAAFTVNILSGGQEAISRRFAEQGSNRFDGLGFQPNRHGGVVLDGAIGYLECERVSQVPAGDHSLFIARVVGGETLEGAPLLYYRGGYTGLTP
jgi:3-hydroxy-9,10-secoandrosta-1,3,5(10)-triene-9,17-dione monooxygenase reductase component